MTIITSVCLSLITRLAHLPRVDDAPAFRDEIDVMKSNIQELENEWLEMAATEYAADRMMITYKPRDWDRRAICRAWKNCQPIFKDLKYNDEFTRYRIQFINTYRSEKSKKKS